MDQAILLRTLILSSILCMALCSTSVPASPLQPATAPDDKAAAAKDGIAISTAIPTLGTPMGSNSTKSNPTASGDVFVDKPTPDGKPPATPGSSSIPGVLSADGKCTCPGVPTPSAGLPPMNTSQQPGSESSTPPVVPENTPGASTNDTSSTSFLKAPTSLCLVAVAAVAGMNALIA